jgi:hypothetical protein
MGLMMALFVLLLAVAVPYSNSTETLARHTVDGDRWAAQNVYTFIDGQRMYDSDRFELRNNGRLVFSEEQGPYAKAEFLSWPFRAHLFVYSTHSGVGHGQSSRFYVIRDHKLFGPVLYKFGEPGGPIFKDLDRDGRPEMIFDNYNYHEFYSEGPTKYLAYKVSRDYRFTFWKELPNPRRRHVKWRLPSF